MEETVVESIRHNCRWTSDASTLETISLKEALGLMTAHQWHDRALNPMSSIRVSPLKRHFSALKSIRMVAIAWMSTIPTDLIHKKIVHQNLKLKYSRCKIEERQNLLLVALKLVKLLKLLGLDSQRLCDKELKDCRLSWKAWDESMEMLGSRVEAPKIVTIEIKA